MRSFLTSLVAGAFLALAVGALFAPRSLSRNYGLPVGDATGDAYVGALGVRDGIIGLLVAVHALRGERRALAATIGLSTLAAIADFALVTRVRGAAAFPGASIHAAGALGLVTLWAMLRGGEGRA